MEEKTEGVTLGQHARAFIAWTLDPEAGKRVLSQLPRYEHFERALREALARLEPRGPAPAEVARKEAEARMRVLWFVLQACSEHPDLGPARARAQEALQALFGEMTPRLASPVDGGPVAERLRSCARPFSAWLEATPDVLPGRTLADVLTGAIDACQRAYALSAARVEPHYAAVVAVNEAVGLVNRMRAAVRTDVMLDPTLPRDLEARLFAAWDAGRERREAWRASTSKAVERKALKAAARAAARTAKAEAGARAKAQVKASPAATPAPAPTPPPVATPVAIGQGAT